MNRRSICTTLAAAALAPVAARAQTPGPAWPTQPIRIVIGFPPGGPTDAIVRTLGEALRPRLGQPVIVENKPGAGSSIANEYVARARPDGHTLLLGGSSLAILAATTRVPYDAVADFAPISQVLELEIFLIVRADSPARTLPELVDLMRRNPGRLSYGSIGNGSITHLQMELFKAMARVYAVHIPYRGNAAAMLDLLAGRIDLLFADQVVAGPHLKSGALRALALAMPNRSARMPEVPTMAELLPDYEATGWTGLLAPAGTPAPIVERLNREVIAALADPAVQARLAAIGAIPSGSTPARMGRRLEAEVPRWRELVRTQKLTID